LKNFACRRERLDENCPLVGDVIRYCVEILKRKGKVFGECSIVADNAKHGSARTMSLQAALTKIANGRKAMRRARNVNLASHAATEPGAFLVNGNACRIDNFTDKLMARGSAKSMIAAKDFHIRIANSGKTNFYQRPAVPQLWHGFLNGFQFSAI